MASTNSIIAITGTGIAIEAVTKIANGKQPFNAMLAGGVFMGALVLLSTASLELAQAFAIVFLITVFVQKADPIAGIISGLGNQKG